MVTSASRLPGFGLIEVIVALMVLATAALGVAGMMTWAAGQMRSAESDEAVVSAAESVLDSLLAFAAPADGSRSAGAGSIHWSVEPSRSSVVLDLHLRFAGGARPRALRLRVTRVNPPPLAAAP